MAAAGHPLVGDPLYAPGGLPHPAAAGAPGRRDDGSSSSSSSNSGGDSESGAEAAAGTGAGPARAEGAGEEERAGGAALPGDCGYLLHCLRMEFAHPVTGAHVCVTSPPPPELA